jgi:hypothetical protein
MENLPFFPFPSPFPFTLSPTSPPPPAFRNFGSILRQRFCGKMHLEQGDLMKEE